MKIVDIDLLFEKYVRKFITENAGKFTEEEWEDKVPELYAEFGDTPLKELDGKSPVGYYSVLSAEQLCSLLESHIEQEIPVSDYLCSALENGDTEDGLMKFLSPDTDEELMSYAVNILRDKSCFRALPIYLKYVVDPKTDDNMRELMGEILIDNAKEITGELIKASKTCKAGMPYIVEALANCERQDDIYNILKEQFAKTQDVSAFAHYFVKYGDERAIDLLKQKIADKTIKYAVYVELKYAIEALGGEYEDDRDFSSDKTYRKIKNMKN